MSFGTIIFIIVILLGIALGYLTTRHDVRDRLFNNLVNDERHLEKERRKRMIIKHLKDRKKITNDEVQKLLGVAHGTATRYFDELQNTGVIIERGEGSGVYYELVK
jgi:Fic family protein